MKITHDLKQVKIDDNELIEVTVYVHNQRKVDVKNVHVEDSMHKDLFVNGITKITLDIGDDEIAKAYSYRINLPSRQGSDSAAKDLFIKTDIHYNDTNRKFEYDKTTRINDLKLLNSSKFIYMDSKDDSDEDNISRSDSSHMNISDLADENIKVKDDSWWIIAIIIFQALIIIGAVFEIFFYKRIRRHLTEKAHSKLEEKERAMLEHKKSLLDTRKSIREEYNSTRDRIINLANRYNNLKEVTPKKESTLEKRKGRIKVKLSALDNKEKHIIDRLTDINRELEIVKQKKTNLTQDMAKIDLKEKSFDDKVKEIISEIQKKRQNINDARIKYDKIIDEIEQIDRQMKEFHLRKMEQINKEIKNLEESIGQIDTDSRKTKSKRRKLEKELSEIKAEMENQQSITEEFKRKIERYSESIQKLEVPRPPKGLNDGLSLIHI